MVNIKELSENGVFVPAWVAQDPLLSEEQKAVLAHIIWSRTEDGFFCSDDAWLAVRLGMRPEKVGDLIAGLAKKGYLRTELFQDSTGKVVARRIWPLLPD